MKSRHNLSTQAKKNQRTELQWILAKIGSKWGLNAWIPPRDWSKNYEEESLGSLVIEALPLKNEIEQEIQFVDVVFFDKNNQVVQIFCIENKEEGVDSKLLQISDFILLRSKSLAPIVSTFNLIVPKSMEEKAKAKLLRPAFHKIGLETRCRLTVIEDWQEMWEKLKLEPALDAAVLGGNRKPNSEAAVLGGKPKN